MVHTVTFRGAMVIYNRTIYGEIHNKTTLRARGHPLGRWARSAPGPVIDGGPPELPRTIYTILHNENAFYTRYNNLQVYNRLRNNKTFSRARENPFRSPGVEPCQVRESSRPRASLYRTLHKLLPMHKKIILQKL